MAKPLAVDWNMVQSLYLKGLTPKHIETQTGIKADTVSNRAHRYKWRESLQTANGTIKAVGLPISEEQPTSAIAKASAIARERLSNEILRSLETLTNTKHSKRLESQRERAGVIQTLSGACKPVFGWSEGQSAPAVRIQVMGNAVIAPEPAPLPASPTAPELPNPT